MGDVVPRVVITLEDVQPELDYWGSAMVCYIIGIKPPYRIIDGFIRGVWRSFGVHKVVLLENEGIYDEILYHRKQGEGNRSKSYYVW